MVDVINIGKNAKDVTASSLQVPYSKVSIIVDENTSFEAGDDTGLTLELECPWGTQEMAENILQQVNGYQYQPFNVTDAIVNPVAELGDAIQANGIYGGMYQQDASYGRTFYSDFSAPVDEQINHEYTYESDEQRMIIRERQYTKSQFAIEDDKIAAKVSQTGGDSSSFGWELLSTGFTLSSGSKTVFSCDSTGVTVNGVIRATSGRIGGTYSNGSWSGGFVIEKDKMWSGQNSYSSGDTAGVYIGTDGIGLGKGNFYVSKNGSLVAKTGTIGSGSYPWVIGSNGLYRGKTTFSSVASGIFIGNDGISIGAGSKKTVTNVSSLPSTGETGVIYHVTSSNKDYYWNGSSFVAATESDLWKYTAPLQLKSNGQIIAQNIRLSNSVTFVDSLGNSSTLSASKLTDGTITEGKLGGNSVTSPKIKGGAVKRTKVDDSVGSSLDHGDSAYAAVNSLTAGTVQSYSLKSSYLNITNTANIATAQVSTLKVKDGSINRTASWKSKTIGDVTISYLGQ